jgi:GMP synthase-like glutamine amidotransferase
MTFSKSVLNVAVFNCGYTSPCIQERRGQYDEIFAALLQPSLERVRAKTATNFNISLNVRGYDTVKQEYPVTLDEIDAIIISGSPNGAYQQLAWIQTLCQYVSCILPLDTYPTSSLY